MRLLSTRDLSFQEFVNDPPPYLIMSHIWGRDEVCYTDVVKWTVNRTDALGGAAKTRDQAIPRHYHNAKLLFGGAEAKRRGLEYFSIDTCGIDRSSSAELSESINSMFRWFQEAAVCCVILGDIEEPGSDPVGSKWFTRSWTLQELIAPSSVEFFTRGLQSIGSKSKWSQEISRKTGVPIDVLENRRRFNDYSVSDRMRWASGRAATREEDKAYCMMGLLEINLSVLYGEGGGAMQRLQREIMEITNQGSGLRLLRTDADSLVLETFSDASGIQYGILSHTWGASEVSFKDVMLGKASARSGYDKIRECCRQARKDGLRYLWADTCCINKDSSAELQEAICSMFKWYKNARICYVYLEDYAHQTGVPLTSHLSNSRWFGRGWTLRMLSSSWNFLTIAEYTPLTCAIEELIAPQCVVFFDQTWQQFGTKLDLSDKLAEITGINWLVLIGDQLPKQRSIAERMSWAAHRATTRVEDRAYSLMGLLDVVMPMLYGEGERAFVRLQEEILRQTEDLSIFAWEDTTDAAGVKGILARSPLNFQYFTRRGTAILAAEQTFRQYSDSSQPLD